MSFVANYNSNSPEPNSPEPNSPKPLDTIEKAIQDKFKEYFKPSENYKITFTFEGTDNETKEYSTIFKFSYSGITNNCITISLNCTFISNNIAESFNKIYFKYYVYRLPLPFRL